MLSIVYSAGLFGLDGYPVTVECDASGASLDEFELVGLPDAAVKEAKERVRSAAGNSGFTFPDCLHILIHTCVVVLALKITRTDTCLEIGQGFAFLVTVSVLSFTSVLCITFRTFGRNTPTTLIIIFACHTFSPFRFFFARLAVSTAFAYFLDGVCHRHFSY